MLELDLWSETFRADPYPAYARLRTEAPLYHASGPMGVEYWLITRYEQARAALADPRLSTDLRYAPRWMRDVGLVTAEGEGPTGNHMLNSDPPDHTRLRKLVGKAFTRRRMDELRPRIQEITDTLIDAMTQHEVVDLIAALALPLPVTVICELLDVPAADRAAFHDWSRQLVSAPLTEDGATLRRQAFAAIQRYIGELVSYRRSGIDLGIDPQHQPDLVSALIAAADEHGRLTQRELLGMIHLLLVAGHETTTNLIGNGTLALLRHPDQLQLLRARPELLPSAIEELLRYDGPVERATPRFTTEDLDMGGQTVPARSAVFVVLASADRDPEHTPETNTLDISRTNHSHLAFGHGIHHCLGAPLARLEGQIAIGALLRSFPDVRLASPPDELRWRAGVGTLRGLEALHLRLR